MAQRQSNRDRFDSYSDETRAQNDESYGQNRGRRDQQEDWDNERGRRSNRGESGRGGAGYDLDSGRYQTGGSQRNEPWDESQNDNRGRSSGSDPYGGNQQGWNERNRYGNAPGWQEDRGPYGGQREGARGPGQYGQRSNYGRSEESQGFGPGMSGSPWPLGENSVQSNHYPSSANDRQGSGRQSYRGVGPKGYERSDDRLKELICEHLTEHHDIDASEVSVEVNKGEVTLSGQVCDRNTRHQIENLVDACGGVKEIHNNLRVQSARSGNQNPQSPGTDKLAQGMDRAGENAQSGRQQRA